MCGRFTLTSPADIVAEFFEVSGLTQLEPRYNIAPTQRALVIRASPGGEREQALLRWGLIPSWAKDRAIGNKLINARGETVAEKPSFRTAFKRRRCLVATDGFYEWQPATAKGAPKTPYWISPARGTVMAFAGLWEHWQPSDGEALETFTIITTEANSFMAPIHKRMPVILDPKDFDVWLDPHADDGAALERVASLLRACRDDQLRARAVTTYVNSPRNDDARCLDSPE